MAALLRAHVVVLVCGLHLASSFAHPVSVPVAVSSSSQCSLLNATRTNGHDIGNATTSSSAECCDVCAHTVGCTYFTFVEARSLCWLKFDGLGGSQHDPGCVSGTVANPAKFRCSTDTDCNHAGTCSPSSGECACDAPFHGERCEQFTLYSYKPGAGGLEMPQGNTTWGGSVVMADDGTHHMWVACRPPLSSF